MPRVSRPKQRRPGGSTLRYWTAADLRTFLRAAQGEHLYPALHLAAFTGMRRGEVCGLRWADVDLDAGVVTVRQTRTSSADLVVGTGTHVVVGEPKTGHGRRVDLDPATVTVLKGWRRQQAEDRLALGGSWPDHGLVFTDAGGQPPHPDTVSGSFDRVVAGAPVPRITLHGLRHTHATILLAAGTPVKVVSERLGHRDVTTTLNYYGHVIPGIQGQAAAAFAEAVGGL